MEQPTVLTQQHPAPSRRPRATTLRRLRLKPVRRLTRTHLALESRPGLREAGRSTLDALGQHLSTQLSVPVSLTARLADATLNPLATLSSHAVHVVLELSGGALALLELDGLLVAALLHRAAGGPAQLAGTTKLTRIEEAALGWVSLGALAAVRAVEQVQRRFAPRLVGVFTSRADALAVFDGRHRHLCVDVDAVVGEHHGSARLLLPATWLGLRCEEEPVSPPGPLHPNVATASLPATVLLGLVSLRPEDIEAFVPGDVLVFPGVRHGLHLTGPARLVTPSFTLVGAFGVDGFILTQVTTGAPPMTADDPTLPIDVEIELTRLRLPLHQLGTLKPGAVLPLHVSAAQAVVIRIGDRAVARAELVDLDGEVGARVLSML